MPQQNQRNRFGVSALVEKILSWKVLSKLSDEERAELDEDIELVRRLLGEQRTPRIAVVGAADVSLPAVVKSILGESIDGDPTVKERLGRQRWYDYDTARGTLRLLDLRADPDHATTTQAIGREEPDLVLFLWSPGHDELVGVLEKIVGQCQSAWGTTPATVAAIVEPAEDDATAGDFEPGATESELRRALVASTVPNESFDVVMRRDEARLVEVMVRRAPMQVRVRLAHLTWVRESKREVAQTVVRAASGIAGAVATVPIPVADIVPITGLQMAMIATIAHISGRELEFRNAWEFVLAMGANLGLSFAFRSVARTAVRFIPVAGSIIAAGIASSATYALGQAAIAYFVPVRKPTPVAKVG